MNTLSKSLLALGLAALMTAPASAQQRRGPGGPGFGGRGLGVSMLLSNSGVQDELKLDDAQKSKVQEVAAAARSKFEAARSETEGLQGQERMAKVRELTKGVDAESLKAVSEVLKPEQLARLHGIHYQVAGASAFQDEALQKKLDLTSEQKSAVDEIITASNSELRGLFQGGGGDREAMMSKMAEHRKATLAKVEAKLTAEQKAEYAKLLGAPFELKFEGRGPGR
ncbi:hypothetical protein [Planctomyces sp. SH-PL62]|uniref:hypothetical protein n=1 Tax=Planctomyces sp. SH-PL62 TaxID=1636152 RepID=UPI00078EA352|nr:hypothetical protein [Planctomyces sp. SH-PL62]AMV36768.1 periplasmic repressor CpxP [Planctomyces sp. SH-PL62]